MSNPIKVFISYSHKDEEYKNVLNKWLKPYETAKTIEVWDDRNLILGQTWHTEINKRLQAAHVILYLVSPDFMASDYITDVELRKAMERHVRGEQVLVPIIIRPSNMAMLDLRKFQATPKDAKPISIWPNQDEAWMDVISSLSKLFTAIKDGTIKLGKASEPTPDFSTPPEERPSPQQEQHDLSEVKTRISQDRLDEAIKKLLVITTDEKYAYYNDTVIMQSGALARLKDQEINGLITKSEANMTRAKIRYALNSTLKDMQQE